MAKRIDGIVLFGDVVGSRHRPDTTAWLEQLTERLGHLYRDSMLAGFDFTQGDELQGLLRLDADPFQAVLSGMLTAGDDVPEMRWVVVAGAIDPGSGPATRRNGPAFLAAREVMAEAKHRRDRLIVRTGEPDTDVLLDDTAPVLASLIERLTQRQRKVAQMALVEGLRQSVIAERLGVRRATISVSFARGDVRSLSRLLDAVRKLWAIGLTRAVARAAK